MDERTLFDLLETPTPSGEHQQGPPGSFGTAPLSFQDVGYVYKCDCCEEAVESLEDDLDDSCCPNCPIGLLHPIDGCIHTAPEPPPEEEQPDSEADLEWAAIPWSSTNDKLEAKKTEEDEEGFQSSSINSGRWSLRSRRGRRNTRPRSGK